MKIWPFLLAFSFAPNSANAAEHQFKSGEPVTVNQQDAYVLVRTFSTVDGGLRGRARYAPILIRELADDELQKVRFAFDKDPFRTRPDAEPNVAQPIAKEPFAETDDVTVMLMSLKPGTYVLSGLSVTNWAMKAAGVALTCLCMGTVKFEAKPGVVTDLGTILYTQDDRPTDIPEFAKVVSGKPRGFGYMPPQVGLRPATAETLIPDGLAGVSVVPAAYTPVGYIPNYIRARISRLAPIPGVLAYDEHGQAIGMESDAGSMLPSRDAGQPRAPQ